MQIFPQTSDNLYFLSGGGEMGQLTREFDWAATPVGNPDQWPQSLQLALSMILSSKFPMFLWWGEELIQFYNDAYRPSLGNNGKHPLALGQKGEDCWPEIWPIIYPLIKQVRETAQATWSEDQLVPIFRNGKIEDVYWTFGYSPILEGFNDVKGVLVVCTETTEKVKSLKTIAESEQRFRTMAESTQILIAVADETGQFTYFNKVWIDLTGRSAEDLFSFGWVDLVHPDDRESYLTIYANALRKKESFSGEFRVQSKNGEYRWLLVSAPPRLLSDGTFAGHISSCMDITERKIAEEKLQKREELVRSMVDSAPFPIGVYSGREMRIELANQAILDVWGKGYDVVGKLYAEVLPELGKQDIFSQLDLVYTTGIPYHARNQRVDLFVDGRLRPYYFNYSFTPLHDDQGIVYGVMNTAADITDLNLAKQKVEKSEENLRNMILQAPVAMCILLGPTHVIEVANELMIQLWGKRAEDILDKPVFEALPDAKQQGLEQLLDNVYNTGESFRASERLVALIRNGNPENVYLNFVYEPYRATDGTILGVLAISTDVTEQVLARHKIEKSGAELLEIKNRLELELKAGKQLQQQKDDFIGIASHELKTPLTALKSSMQLLNRWIKEDPSSSKIQTLISLSNSSINKLNNLLEELLNDTKINEGQLQLNKSNFSIAELVNECCDHIRAVGSHEILASGDLDLQVNADRARIDQVIINLINNAVKYAPQSKTITVFIEQRDEQAKISVIDKGPGIPPEKLPHLFKRYYRADTSGIQYSGLGLGLFISSEIIHRHGGEIGVNSEPGKGSTFWFTIPIKGKH